MESIFLNIEAVNTHRERPQVSRATAVVKGTMDPVGLPEEGQLENIIAFVIRILGRAQEYWWAPRGFARPIHVTT